MNTVAFITSSPEEVATASERLRHLGVELHHVQLDLDELQSGSVEGVARHKAQEAFGTLRRPLIVQETGFYIDELGRFPGPMTKYLVHAVGAAGIARLADLTRTRRCHFEHVLAFVDPHGEEHVFVDDDQIGSAALTPADGHRPDGPSGLWDVFIPHGAAGPLSELPAREGTQVLHTWERHSVLARFAGWLLRKRADDATADLNDSLTIA